MQSLLRTVTGAAKVASLSLLTSGLIGCAASPADRAITAEYARTSVSQGTLLHAELGRLIENALSGTVLHAASTPWGEEVEITVATLYDAASGRQCRDLFVQSQQIASTPAIVCRIQPGQWESVRPIARGVGL